MNSNHLKTYIILFISIFFCLFFITWQQIEIFRMGYRLTRLKRDIRLEEINKQNLMKTASIKMSLFSIEHKVRTNYSMYIPSHDNYRLLSIRKSEIIMNDKEKKSSLLVRLGNILSPREAEAK
ncbi:hypothetical protein ACFLTD_01780 [Elusimicrobiota bacterium]